MRLGNTTKQIAGLAGGADESKASRSDAVHGERHFAITDTLGKCKLEPYSEAALASTVRRSNAKEPD